MKLAVVSRTLQIIVGLFWKCFGSFLLRSFILRCRRRHVVFAVVVTVVVFDVVVVVVVVVVVHSLCIFIQVGVTNS